MNFTDTHTHIYSEEFDPDLDAVVKRALDLHVSRLFLPAIDSGHHEKMLRICDTFPQSCFPMMGLHPTSVTRDFEKELDIVESYIATGTRKFYAIGEIGIDLYWDKTFAHEQGLAFNRQVDLALKQDLPVVIHTRNSMDIVLDMLEARGDNRLHGIFHCFGGNNMQAQRAVSLGFLLGIGGVLTYKNSGLQQVVEKTGLETLVLETDAPWLPPVPHRGQRNEPSYIPVIAARIAEIKNVPLEEVAETTTRNALNLFTP